MKLILALITCISFISISYAQEFKAKGKGYEYGFSEIKGWVGIGQDTENFPHADMIFYAADRNGEDVNIRHVYTDIYMFTNVTTGTADQFWKQLETRYRTGNPRLKIEHAKYIKISAGVEAKVIYFLNITSENKAQAIASIPNKGRIVSLVMQARSEQLLKEHLPEFEQLLRTYKASEVGVVGLDK